MMKSVPTITTSLRHSLMAPAEELEAVNLGPNHGDMDIEAERHYSNPSLGTDRDFFDWGGCTICCLCLGTPVSRCRGALSRKLRSLTDRTWPIFTLGHASVRQQRLEHEQHDVRFWDVREQLSIIERFILHQCRPKARRQHRCEVQTESAPTVMRRVGVSPLRN